MNDAIFFPFFPLTTEFKADGIIAIKKKVTRYFKYEEVDEKKKNGKQLKKMWKNTLLINYRQICSYLYNVHRVRAK